MQRYSVRYVQACTPGRISTGSRAGLRRWRGGLLCSCKLRLEMITEEFSPLSDTMMTQMLLLHRCSNCAQAGTSP